MGKSNSDIIALVMRMVVPVRHEFGKNIDIQHLLSDSQYAESIIVMASSSRNEQLREHARYLESMIHGPRGNAQPAAGPSRPGPALSGQDEAAENAERDKQRQALLQKYRSGLR